MCSSVLTTRYLWTASCLLSSPENEVKERARKMMEPLNAQARPAYAIWQHLLFFRCVLFTFGKLRGVTDYSAPQRTPTLHYVQMDDKAWGQPRRCRSATCSYAFLTLQSWLTRWLWMSDALALNIQSEYWASFFFFYQRLSIFITVVGWGPCLFRFFLLSVTQYKQ